MEDDSLWRGRESLVNHREDDLAAFAFVARNIGQTGKLTFMQSHEQGNEMAFLGVKS